MSQAGGAYRPSGAFDAAGTIFAATTGLIAAAVCAAIVWGWEISGLPTLIIITSVFHGVAIGFVLAWLFKKARLRNPGLAVMIAALCALLSVAVVHYGHYLWFLHELEPAIAKELNKSTARIAPDRRERVLSEVHANPAKYADELVLVPETGHGGFAGSMLLRAKAGETISRHGTGGIEITGIGMWILWSIEAVFVVGAAIGLTAPVAKEPFCETCGRWFDRSDAQLRMAPAQADVMIAAVRGGDPEAVGKLHAAASNPATSVMPRVYTCGDCGQHLADVVTHAAKEKGGYTDTTIMPPTYVSPEVAAALRCAPPAAETPTA